MLRDMTPCGRNWLPAALVRGGKGRYPRCLRHRQIRLSRVLCTNDRWGTKPEAEQQHGVRRAITPGALDLSFHMGSSTGNRPLCLVFHTNPPPSRVLPFPRVSLCTLLSILVAESPCGPEPCLRSAETRSTTSIKGLAAGDLAS